ncbi:Protein of unknown function [Leuconostoc citreum]|nr:Protein of unknown function [Leuconostoc citreum LBAE C10]CCF25716.1 Protein of unknown function [Leuconostoc citreum LBAE C11]CCF28092.1 Protein of unknown function [Leuconostoc citreum LBAE E16]CDX64585.1 Protein of unknown function [Leuconostoc citreum]CDX66285.1 Protein of unknown function [Leuconostoc citreum]
MSLTPEDIIDKINKYLQHVVKTK